MYKSKICISNQEFISNFCKKIGNGSFGEIYQAKNSNSNQDFALKLESIDSEHLQLEKEHNFLKLLCGEKGFTSTNIYFKSNGYKILVMDLFGQNLEDAFKSLNLKFSLKTILSISIQIISRLKKIHSRHIIHRDLKPANLVNGELKQNKHIIYLIDFGLSKRFRNEYNGEHIPYRDDRPFIGNARFASIYSHLGIEQSRRDDLISLSYIILYFYNGILPWQGIKCKTNLERNSKISQMKISMSPEEIFKGTPSEFLKLYTYCFNLHFDEKPDYGYIKSLVNSLAMKESIKLDDIFDWNLLGTDDFKQQAKLKQLKSENGMKTLSGDEFSTFINE